MACNKHRRSHLIPSAVVPTTIEQEATMELEWRACVPNGSSVKLEREDRPIYRAWSGITGFITAFKVKVVGFMSKAWKVGEDDPRKVFHGFKVGLALTIVSLFYYTRPLYDGVGGTAMWAVMTVVVVFEFTVGGTLYKGFNRVTATSLAGSLAVGVHYVASLSGEKVEPVILGASLFLLASAATFSRFIPTIKAKFDYGVTIFILTFSLVSISGYRVEKLLEMAEQRLLTIAIGCSICLMICMLVRPVWAGTDLHCLVTRNLEKLANSIEDCVAVYFDDGDTNDDDDGDRDNKTYQKSQGYNCVLNSKASEDSLANLARWETAHGNFGFRHPWQQYLKVSAAMRSCASCVKALHASISSEAQVPEVIKRHLSGPCTQLSSQSCKVLKELSNSMSSMTKPSNIDFLVVQVNNAVEELQSAIKSIPCQLPVSPPMQSQAEETTEQQTNQLAPAIATIVVPFSEVLPIVNVASLLIEVHVRIRTVIEAVDALTSHARFKNGRDDKSKQVGKEKEGNGLQMV